MDPSSLRQAASRCCRKSAQVSCRRTSLSFHMRDRVLTLMASAEHGWKRA